MSYGDSSRHVLQITPILQPGQQGRPMLNIATCQYRLVKILGSTPAAGTHTAPHPHNVCLSNAPAYHGMGTVSTSVAPPAQIPGQMPAGLVAPLVVTSSSAIIAHTTPPLQPPTVTRQITPVLQPGQQGHPMLNIATCQYRLVKILGSTPAAGTHTSPHPHNVCLLNAPAHHGMATVSTSVAPPGQIPGQLPAAPVAPSLVTLCSATIAPATSSSRIMTVNKQQRKPAAKEGNSITVLENIPFHTKMNMNKIEGNKVMTVNRKANFTRTGFAALSTVICPGKSLLKYKEMKPVVPLHEKKKSMQYSSQPYVGGNDHNYVAAMSGVNLPKETKRISSSTKLNDKQTRSFEDEHLISMSRMQVLLQEASSKYDLEEPSPEVAKLFGHAVRERTKSFIEKLVTITHHRIEKNITLDSRYKVTHDVKGQLTFLEDLENLDNKRREYAERMVLLRAARSRSKNGDPEFMKLKARAKEMLRADLEKAKKQEANEVSLLALGPRKKRRADGPGGSGDNASNSTGHNVSAITEDSFAMRMRLHRIHLRDMLFLLEQERQPAQTLMLYRNYLK